MNPSQIEQKVKQTLKKIKIHRSVCTQEVQDPKLQNKGAKKSKILVALSGGKDSAVVAYLLKKFGYNIEGFHIDLKIGKYSEECLEKVMELSEILEIKLHIYDFKKEMGSGMCYLRTAIQSSYKKKEKGQLKNCAICGVIKKWILNKEARKIRGVKYLATGHNLDDEAQTFLLNILKGSPKLSANSGTITKNIPDEKFIPRIKPLFYIPEKDVRNYSIEKKLPVNYSKCPCALDSYRIQLRNFLEKMDGGNKENIIKNFNRLIPRMQKMKNAEMNYCEICGEPSRNQICKMCEMINLSK